ncbi:MAG: archaeosortase/exosortase family protein [Conexivisphaerales archaeon]
MKLSTLHEFVASIVVLNLIPFFIPGMGLDYPYLFIFAIVLVAWFSIKWNKIKNISRNSEKKYLLMGMAIIASDYVLNYLNRSSIGLLDMIAMLLALVLIFYGIKALKVFWVPAAYGLILLAGYQLENFLPNFVLLQNWLTSVMLGLLHLFGINASGYEHYITLNTSSTFLVLNVESACTGVQGILAFGMLSSIAIIDVKTRASRLILVLLLGFAGAFAINIVRLFGVILAFDFLGVEIGTMMHVYLGYVLFIFWVLVFWYFAPRYFIVEDVAKSAGSQVPSKLWQ